MAARMLRVTIPMGITDSVIDRQHQVLEVLNVPSPMPASRRAHTHGRQHVQFHREHDHQHDTEPVVRNADAGNR